MITKVNDIDLRVLALFTKGYNKEHYIREAEKLLGVSSRTALLTLDKLEKKGVLESKPIGKTIVYFLRETAISREYLLLAEQYKKIAFLEKNPLIREMLDKSGDAFGGIAAVFGSYAKEAQKKDSDLDLFIVGKHDPDRIRAVGIKYGIEISIKSYPSRVFERGLHDDILLKEIAENHILILGAEEFVGRVAKWNR